MKEIKAKPVTIISGFLGAGKTTFLNAWIAGNKESRPFIIENEFGKEGIDAGLIVSTDADIFELNSGCLCCNLNEDFYDLLGALWEREEEFDELIIETTCIADPATVAEPFMAIPQLQNYYCLQRVICLVDAQLIEFELEETQEARKQIAFSDVILINKSDSVNKDYLRELAVLLSGINPFARILTGNKDEGYPIAGIKALTRGDVDEHYQQAGRDRVSHDVGFTPHEHHHHDITSLSFVFEEPFNLDEFEYRLLVFLNAQAGDIYRLKGFIHADGIDKRIIVQSVASLLAITEGEDWPWEDKRLSRLVVIGRNLKAKGFDRLFRQCIDVKYRKL